MKGFFQEGNALLWERNYEKMRIEPWGTDSLRVRASMGTRIQMELPGGLIEQVQGDAQIEIGPEKATIRNGDITAVVLENGDMRFINSAGVTLLEEELRPNHQSNCPRRAGIRLCQASSGRSRFASSPSKVKSYMASASSATGG